MTGPVVLCGGNEFEEASIPLSRAILKLAAKKQPRIAVLPIAATDNPRKAVRSGMGHFKSLNAQVEAMLISDAKSANDGSLTGALETSEVIYLTDGNPADAVQNLANTDALNRLRHYWGAGTILAASGAAAMALCDHYWDSGMWEKGLGLLKGIVVLPHYEHLAGRYSGEQLRQGLPSGYTILGIEEATGVIIDGTQARVVGPEAVTVFHADSENEYLDGASFSLEVPVS